MTSAAELQAGAGRMSARLEHLSTRPGHQCAKPGTGASLHRNMCSYLQVKITRQLRPQRKYFTVALKDASSSNSGFNDLQMG